MYILTTAIPNRRLIVQVIFQSEKEMATHSSTLESHGWRSLVGCSPRGRKESDTTERLHFTSLHMVKNQSSLKFILRYELKNILALFGPLVLERYGLSQQNNTVNANPQTLGRIDEFLKNPWWNQKARQENPQVTGKTKKHQVYEPMPQQSQTGGR